MGTPNLNLNRAQPGLTHTRATAGPVHFLAGKNSVRPERRNSVYTYPVKHKIL